MILLKKKFQRKNTKTQFTIQKLNGKNRMLPISKKRSRAPSSALSKLLSRPPDFNKRQSEFIQRNFDSNFWPIF